MARTVIPDHRSPLSEGIISFEPIFRVSNNFFLSQVLAEESAGIYNHGFAQDHRPGLHGQVEVLLCLLEGASPLSSSPRMSAGLPEARQGHPGPVQ